LQHVDGVSFLRLLIGRQTGRSGDVLHGRPLFWHYPHYGEQGGAPAGAVRLGDFKLVEPFEGGRCELYDLRTDIGETHDLAASDPKRAAEMHALLRAWRNRVGAIMPQPNPDWPIEL